MSSFEWVELETLTSDIETARSRLAEARKRNNHGAIGALEVEITRAEKRRAQLLAHISTNVAIAPEPAPHPISREGAGSRQASAPVVEALQDEADAELPPGETASAPEPAPLPEAKDGANSGQASAPVVEALQDEADADAEQPPPDRVHRIVASGAASSASALKADRVEGAINMWDQLTPNDLDRAKNSLAEQRAEMLARHAEEVKALDADQSQLEILEQAIETFLRKFNPSSPESAVVKLDQERELRQQGNS